MRERFFIGAILTAVAMAAGPGSLWALPGKSAGPDAGTTFFERRVRPILVEHCYECHSEKEGEQKGGLLLDREMGWLDGGDTGKAIVPGDPEASLLVTAVRYDDEDFEMPPKYRLRKEDIAVLEQWVRRGAPGPAKDMGETEFSQLGDQDYIFGKAETHWAFQPVVPPAVPETGAANEIDAFAGKRLAEAGLEPSPGADDRTLVRRLYFDLIGLPPSPEASDAFVNSKIADPSAKIETLVDELLADPAFGEKWARHRLDVARYADTDSSYRFDTASPKYLPFAFTYRNYVIDAFNADKPIDGFIREQLAADLMTEKKDAPELAALGFIALGPHLQNRDDFVDDVIDTTTRGFLGLSAACARCHDHKYEPVPTADYYSLHGVFSSIDRQQPTRIEYFPVISGYERTSEQAKDYETKLAAIKEELDKNKGKTQGANKRSVVEKIEDTRQAELVMNHEGAEVRAMVVRENRVPQRSRIYLRGDRSTPGEAVPRRFLRLLDPEQKEFTGENSGRLDLAEQIASAENPLTARVFVNRVWGQLIGSYLVETPSDFGLQGALPTHPELLDWLAHDFVAQGWSLKGLVRQIVLSETYRQSSADRAGAAEVDPENRWLWRANRKRLSIEAVRDATLAVAGQLDRTPRSRPQPLWGEDYTKRRAIYGFIDRFNVDPTLRAFDFPNPAQHQDARTENLVPQQALFAMNSTFVTDQAKALVARKEFAEAGGRKERIGFLFERVLQRPPSSPEVERIWKFIDQISATGQPAWPLVAHSLMMSNEFLFID